MGALITIANAPQLFTMAFSLIGKAIIAITTKEPQTIDEELDMLEKFRLSPRADIEKEVDGTDGLPDPGE